MRILQKYIPERIRTRYNLETIVADDGYLYTNIKRIIYGIKQSDVLAYDISVDNIS